MNCSKCTTFTLEEEVRVRKLLKVDNLKSKLLKSETELHIFFIKTSMILNKINK